MRADRIGCALADLTGVACMGDVDAAHARLRREGDVHGLRLRKGRFIDGRLAQVACERDDAAAFRRFIGQRRQPCRLGQLLGRHTRRRDEARGLAVAVRDRAGLVEQQHIHVTGRFHGAARRGDHVGLHHAAHARHANGGEQPANGGRDQTYQQRHQHGNRDRRARLHRFHREDRIGQQRDGRQHQDDGQAHQQNRQRQLVGGLLALGALHHRDHPIQEALAGVGGDAHDDPVRQHTRAAGHGREIPARFADDRCRFARDGAFVHRGHAFDDLAVAGHHVAGFDEDDVATAQRGGDARFHAVTTVRVCQHLGLHGGLDAAQRCRLLLAAALGQRLGKVGEQHREPQPHRHGEDEASRRFSLTAQRHDPQDGGEDAADVDDKHHRVLGLRARRQLAEAIDNGGLDQRRREHR